VTRDLEGRKPLFKVVLPEGNTIHFLGVKREMAKVHHGKVEARFYIHNRSKREVGTDGELHGWTIGDFHLHTFPWIESAFAPDRIKPGYIATCLLTFSFSEHYRASQSRRIPFIIDATYPKFVTSPNLSDTMVDLAIRGELLRERYALKREWQAQGYKIVHSKDLKEDDHATYYLGQELSECIDVTPELFAVKWQPRRIVKPRGMKSSIYDPNYRLDSKTEQWEKRGFKVVTAKDIIENDEGRFYKGKRIQAYSVLGDVNGEWLIAITTKEVKSQ